MPVEITKGQTETTFGNAVYLDKAGNVVDKNDPSVMSKISAAEAKRRGLMPETPEPVAPAVEETEEPVETQEKAVKPARNKAVTKANAEDK